MKQLKALSKYLINQKIFNRDNYSSWAESAELVWLGEIVAQDHSVRLFEQRYEAVINISSFNGQAEQLFTHVMLWLNNNKHDFDELGNPEFDVQMEDDDTATVEITINFVADVNIVPDPKGALVLNGETYVLADPEIWVAENLEAVTPKGCSSP